MRHVKRPRYSDVANEYLRANLIGQKPSLIKSSSVVGYCHCDRHKGFLTKQLHKSHECAAKQCPFLEKFEDYPYWKNLELEKRKKAYRRNEERRRLSKKEAADNALLKLAREAQLYCYEAGFPIVITKLRMTEDTNYIVNYVSDNLYNDWALYFGLALFLGKKYRKKFMLRHVKLPDGGYASTDDWRRTNGGITVQITPIYELRARLRAAAIAGTDLLSEDFRLRKAAESFAALADTSPVFARINDMTNRLLEDGSPESLLDTITLVDAVLTTLAAVEVTGDIGELTVTGGGTAVVNAPYSKLSAVLGALTGSGSGQYSAFTEVRNNSPELLNDYRVKPALVKGLGAPYAELADAVGSAILEMGKDMLPLLKKDFDPKGKKETVRRVNVIEQMCGAEENGFYLEQLENAEKDVRTALIYALRHDEGNIGKLTELVKTEKGKAKKTALYALGTFDNEKAAAFFEEYAAKKPAEVVGIMEHLSSEWTSRLTARLIGELLVDDKDNRITLSQAADELHVKLKAKTDFRTLCAALDGKFGADIEEIYRGFDCKDRADFLDIRLGNTIITTGSEELKRLATELNGSSKLKGGYVYSEAIARLSGAEECPKWFEKQIKALPKQMRYSSLFNALKKIMMYEGRFALANQVFNAVTEQCSYAVLPIDESLIYSLSDILMKRFKDHPFEFGGILAGWASASGDVEYVLKILEFLKKMKDKGANIADYQIERLVSRLRPEGGQ